LFGFCHRFVLLAHFDVRPSLASDFKEIWVKVRWLLHTTYSECFNLEHWKGGQEMNEPAVQLLACQAVVQSFITSCAVVQGFQHVLLFALRLRRHSITRTCSINNDAFHAALALTILMSCVDEGGGQAGGPRLLRHDQ